MFISHIKFWNLPRRTQIHFCQELKQNFLFEWHNIIKAASKKELRYISLYLYSSLTPYEKTISENVVAWQLHMNSLTVKQSHHWAWQMCGLQKNWKIKSTVRQEKESNEKNRLYVNINNQLVPQDWWNYATKNESNAQCQNHTRITIVLQSLYDVR